MLIGFGSNDLVLLAMIAILQILPCWRICAKAGLNPAIAAICIIPGGVIVFLYGVAFRRWLTVPEEPAQSPAPLAPPLRRT